MLVVIVQSGMVVEVLLNVDERKIVLCEELSNARSVCGLVSGHFVGVENWWQTSDIEGQDIKGTGGLSKDRSCPG
jgi:hypothetical protein